jgi:ribosomal protein S18 acetylase RimI-like enzyme
MIEIVRAHALDPAELLPLVEESVAAGDRFMRRLHDGYASGANRYEKPGEAFFVAREDGALIGTCGLNQDPYLGDPAIGRVRHVYVLARARRQGLARRLLAAALAEAARGGQFRWLTLRTENPAAAALYRAHGFSEAPRFPDASHWLALPAPGDRAD